MRKKSIKEIDSRQMRKINTILDDKFSIQFSPSAINLLVFGPNKINKRKRKVIGFGSYDALIVAIKKGVPKKIPSNKVYGYLLILANDEVFINDCNKKIDEVKPLTDVSRLSDILK